MKFSEENSPRGFPPNHPEKYLPWRGWRFAEASHAEWPGPVHSGTGDDSQTAGKGGSLSCVADTAELMIWGIYSTVLNLSVYSLLEESQFQFRGEESRRGQEQQHNFKEMLVNHGEGRMRHLSLYRLSTAPALVNVCFSCISDCSGKCPPLWVLFSNAVLTPRLDIRFSGYLFTVFMEHFLLFPHCVGCLTK